jgi:hypothetical protein
MPLVAQACVTSQLTSPIEISFPFWSSKSKPGSQSIWIVLPWETKFTFKLFKPTINPLAGGTGIEQTDFTQDPIELKTPSNRPVFNPTLTMQVFEILPQWVSSQAKLTSCPLKYSAPMLWTTVSEGTVGAGQLP